MVTKTQADNVAYRDISHIPISCTFNSSKGEGHAVMTLRICCVRVCDYLNGFDGSYYRFLKIIESKSVLHIQPKEN